MATEHDAWRDRAVESALRLDTPVRRALQDFLAMSAGFREADRQWVMNDDSTNRPATQAELFSNLYTSRFYRLLNVGLLARLLADEIASGNDHRQIQAASQAAAERLTADGGRLEAERKSRDSIRSLGATVLRRSGHGSLFEPKVA